MGIKYLKASFKMDDVASRVANWFCPLRVRLEFVFKELSFGSGKCYFGISSWLRRYKAIHDNIIIMLDKQCAADNMFNGSSEQGEVWDS